MKTSRRLPLATAAAVLALPVALPLVALPATAAAGPDVGAVLPAAVTRDLTPAQEQRVEDALVTPGAGAVVSVAVVTPGGGLDVEGLDVARGDAAGVARLLDGLGSVEEAAVASVVRATSAAAGTATADPLRGFQWPLQVLRADELRPLLTSTPVVAVLDTGVDGTHPDLDDVLVPGVDLVDGTTGPRAGWEDPQGHGTHVAGIVAAEVGNGVGVEGLLAGARVMPVRVLGPSGSGSTAAIAQGVVAAVDRGASVLNLSLGGPGDDPVLRRAVQYATDHGVLVVAAAGNDGEKGSPTSYPAAYDGVLAVAATDDHDARASFSSVGPLVDLAAPGVQVASTWPDGEYVYASGTSMATPYAAAAAAAVRGAAPELSPADVADVLERTARDLGASGRDDLYGWGRVDPVAAVHRALELAGTTQPAPQDPQPQEPQPQEPQPQEPAVVPPASPGSLVATPGEGSALVRWGAPAATQGAAEVSGYEVRLRAGGRTDRVVETGADERTTTVAGLTGGTTYRVEVRALSAAGAGEPATTDVRPVAPATAPRSLRTVPGDGRAVVSWAAPTSSGTGATAYEVVVSAGGRADVVVRTAPQARSATVTGLANGVDHVVTVRVVTAAGAGPQATTAVRPRTTASAPQRVSAATGSTRDRAVGVVVTWAAPARDGGTPVSAYRLLVRAEGATRDAVVTVRSGAAATQQVAVDGLRRGTRYAVAVQAVTAAGPGAASARTTLVAAR